MINRTIVHKSIIWMLFATIITAFTLPQQNIQQELPDIIIPAIAFATGTSDTDNNKTINGCTDRQAANYDTQAIYDDGSCEYTLPTCADVHFTVTNSHPYTTQVTAFTRSAPQDIDISFDDGYGQRQPNAFAPQHVGYHAPGNYTARLELKNQTSIRTCTLNIIVKTLPPHISILQSSLTITGPTCGDGVVEGREECDDGAHVDGDGCANFCMFEEGHVPACGNDIPEVGEECDGSDDCDTNCQLTTPNTTPSDNTTIPIEQITPSHPVQPIDNQQQADQNCIFNPSSCAGKSNSFLLPDRYPRVGPAEDAYIQQQLHSQGIQLPNNSDTNIQALPRTTILDTQDIRNQDPFYRKKHILPPQYADAKTILVIPRIGLVTPIQTDLPSNHMSQVILGNEETLQQYIDQVTQYPGSALPGHNGATILFGHSAFSRNEYPHSIGNPFVGINLLQDNDSIYIIKTNTLGYDYAIQYHVTAQNIIRPEHTQLMHTDQPGHQLKLITCYPLTENTQRLIITATPLDLITPKQ